MVTTLIKTPDPNQPSLPPFAGVDSCASRLPPEKCFNLK
jgi:hypothetical protein